MVGTGEGKTWIVIAIAIIRSLMNESVDVVTSNSVLAQRDPTSTYSFLFKLFDVKADHIIHDSIEKRTQVYQNKNVLYGDLGSFERDHLLSTFYKVNIKGLRGLTTVIVDEVDSMLLDNGNNILYLTHEVAGMDRLQSLLLFIWKKVLEPIPAGRTPEQVYSTNSIRRSVKQDLYGMLSYELCESIEENLFSKLLEAKVRPNQKSSNWESFLSQDGSICKGFDLTWEQPSLDFLPSDKMKRAVMFSIKQQLNRDREILCPPYLYDFVEQHLDELIDNAKTAFHMAENVDYVVDIDRTGSSGDGYPRIIILDRSTGTDLSTSQWQGGLHQFLQLKHGCKISLMSMKAVFTSNVKYLKSYTNFYGFSGTLGSKDEREILNELYKCEFYVVPSCQPKLFQEFAPIMTRSRDEWADAIANQTEAILKQQRVVLIIAESIRSAKFLKDHLEKKLVDTKKCEQLHVFKRDYESETLELFRKVNGDTVKRKPGEVVLSTNLAGRGMDLKLNDEVKEAGGLHVIVTFVPDNDRVEDQAFGRAARGGDKGSAQLILLDENNEGVFAIKARRNTEEHLRLKDIKKKYENNIMLEEEIFKEFECKYKDLKSKISDAEKDNLKEGQIDELSKIVHEAVLDEWSFFLDKHSHIISQEGDFDSRLKKLKDEFKYLFKDDWKSLVRNPMKILKCVSFYQNIDERFNDANEWLDKLDEHGDYFDAERNYYKAARYIRDNKTDVVGDGVITKNEFKKLKEMLLYAKKGFEARIFNHTCAQHYINAIQDKEKEGKKTDLILVKAFDAQQQSIINIYGKFVQSIDTIMGSVVTEDTIKKDNLTGPIARNVIEYFANKTAVLTEEFKKDNDRLDILKEDCRAAGIMYGFPDLYEKLKQSNKSDAKDIIQNATPERSIFWEALKGDGVLTNSEKYYLIKLKDLQCVADSFEIKYNGKQLSGDTFDLFKIKEFPKAKSPVVYLGMQPFPEIGKDEIVCPSHLIKSDDDCFIYLKKNNVIQLIERATVNEDSLVNPLRSDLHKTLTVDELSKYGIDKKSAEEILENLVANGVMSKDGSNYSILNLDEHSLIYVNVAYRPFIEGVFNIHFIYEIAYLEMRAVREARQQAIKNKEANLMEYTIKIIPDMGRELAVDLVIKNVLSGRMAIYKEDDGKDFVCQQAEKIPFVGKNISFAQVSYDLKNLKPTAKRREEIFEKSKTKELMETLNKTCSSLAPLETADVKFTDLDKETEKDEQVTGNEIKWFKMNGLYYVMKVEEEKWSLKCWLRIGIIMLIAAAQIALGAALEILTAGAASVAANFFIGEGISDLTFAVGAMLKGTCSWMEYANHKIASVITSIATIGVGALMSSVATASKIGVKATSKIASGISITLKVAGKEAIKATCKEIAKKIIKAVVTTVAGHALSEWLKNYINGITEMIRTVLDENAEKNFEEHSIKSTIRKLYEKCSETNATGILSKVLNEMFEGDETMELINSIHNKMNETVKEIVQAHINTSGSTSGDDADTLMKALEAVETASAVAKALKSAAESVGASKKFLDGAKLKLENKLDKAPTDKVLIGSQKIPSEINKVMKNWKATLEEKTDTKISSDIVNPATEFLQSKLIEYGGKAIQEGYKSFFGSSDDKEKERKKEDEIKKKQYHDSQKEKSSDDDESQKGIRELRKKNEDSLLSTKDSPTLHAKASEKSKEVDAYYLEATIQVFNGGKSGGASVTVYNGEKAVMQAGPEDAKLNIKLSVSSKGTFSTKEKENDEDDSDDSKESVIKAIDESMKLATNTMERISDILAIKEKVSIQMKSEDMSGFLQKKRMTYAFEKGFYGFETDEERLNSVMKIIGFIDDDGNLINNTIFTDCLH